MVPLADLKAQYAALEEEIDRAVKDVLRSGEYILGPAVRELEQAVAAASECRFAVGVASGTDAIRLALDALGVGPGAEVLDHGLHLHRHGKSAHSLWGDAGVRGHRPAHVQP